jgi:hypothetical protein
MAADPTRCQALIKKELLALAWWVFQYEID